MKLTLLLDTHALLWWLAADPRMPASVRSEIEEPSHRILASAASAWEISIKSQLGKLKAPTNLLEAVEATGLEWIAIEPSESITAGRLPLHHRDPFDRLLIAQAASRSARLVSRDAALDDYEVDRLWS